MLVLATSDLQLATLIIASVAAVSGIGSAIVAGLFGKRSETRAERLAEVAESRADRRAREAEERAETRAKQLEGRETQREAERWRLERVRSTYDQCVALTEQGLNTLQQLALSMPHKDLDEVTADRQAEYPSFVALQTRIGLLGQEMNAIGESELGADLGLGLATTKLVESLTAGRAELANVSGTAEELMDAYQVAEVGLASFRLTMRGPLLGGD